MTFVDGFYSFKLDISNADRGLYTGLRLKTPKHPYESLPHLYARMLAYAHCYEESVQFSRGMFEVQEPTIWKKDLLGNVELWVQVGVPDEKKLQHVLRQHRDIRRLLYLYEPSQIPALQHALSKCRTALPENISCFEINHTLLEELVPLARSSARWQVTFIDEALYLVVDGYEFESSIQPVELEGYPSPKL
jgi:uncharacterized protein YaeQ